MAKASLNMMTRTAAAGFAKDNIFMTAVDTGWITDENPVDQWEKRAQQPPPLDEYDAAMRVLDPVLCGVRGEDRLWGVFLEILEVDLKDPESTVGNILEILKNERSPLKLYVDFARAFYSKLDRKDAAEGCLKAATEAPGGLIAQQEPVSLIAVDFAHLSRDPHFVQVHYMLACHYIDMIRLLLDGHSIPGETRTPQQLMQQVTELLNKAGNYSLLMNNAEEAAKIFRFALDSESTNVSALIGLATALCAKSDYRGALECYQRVLCLTPESVETRVAIGICYHKLQMVEEATHAFNRVLELDPENADALSLLGVIEWNAARETNNTGVDLFASLVEKNTNSKTLRADACALKAKRRHMEGKYREALEYYRQAVEGNKSSPIHQYGLGQCYIFQGDFDKAIECFENVLKTEPENFESLKPETRTKAMECFKKLRGLFSAVRGGTDSKADEDVALIDEPEIQQELAQLYESVNPKIALAGRLYGATVF
ncbi:hypothetical protein HK101_007862 [Irineochytrium annulatum]|nr:hypothetical protein HK101_007862 [Irineochytrium annulatum]